MNNPTQMWYSQYYEKHGANRNDLRNNKEVLFQVIAQEASIVTAFGRIQNDNITEKVLYVGCGNGGNIYQLIRMGYKTKNITGIDINETRINSAKELYPNINFINRDASDSGLPSNSFGLIYESTMFSTLPNDELCKEIASEMIRVCKKGGFIVLVDWRFKKPNNSNYNALDSKNLIRFFNVGVSTDLLFVTKGALIPPIGRFISKHCPSIYFLIKKIFPFLVGQVVYVLKKIEKM